MQKIDPCSIAAMEILLLEAHPHRDIVARPKVGQLFRYAATSLLTLEQFF